MMDAEAGSIAIKFAKRVFEVFGGGLTGVYLAGSAALGGFRIGKSDIDFTVLLENRPDGETLGRLNEIHGDLARKYRKNPFEGHYITPGELGRTPGEIGPVVSYHDGRLDNSYHNINPVTWFTLKRHGITVIGPPASALGFEAPVGELLSYVAENVNTYWAKWLADSKNLLSLKGVYALTDEAVEWGVAGISRMAYTLKEKDVTSKDGALKYMLDRAPEKFNRILSEAYNIRAGCDKRYYVSPFARKRDMIDYMEYFILAIRNDLC